jgi:hypothetical protein
LGPWHPGTARNGNVKLIDTSVFREYDSQHIRDTHTDPRPVFVKVKIGISNQIDVRNPNKYKHAHGLSIRFEGAICDFFHFHNRLSDSSSITVVIAVKLIIDIVVCVKNAVNVADRIVVCHAISVFDVESNSIHFEKRISVIVSIGISITNILHVANILYHAIV